MDQVYKPMIFLFGMLLLTLTGIIIVIATPAWAVVLLLGLSSVESISLTIGRFDLPVFQWATAVFLIGCVIRRWITQEPLDQEIGYPALAVGAVSWLSVPLSIHPGAALQSALVVLIHAAVFYFAAFYIQTLSDCRRLKPLPMGVAVWLILAAGLTFSNTQDWDTFHLRACFSDANAFVTALVSLLPLLFLTIVRSTRRGYACMYSLITIMVIALLLATQTLSGLVLFIACVMISGFLGVFPRQVFYAIAALPAVGLLLLGIADSVNLISIHEWQERIFNSTRVQIRAQNAVLALMTFAEHPMVGVGVGQWEVYARWAYKNVSFALRDTYSSFPVLIAEQGICGLIVYGYLFQSIGFPAPGKTDTTDETALERKALAASVWIWIVAALLYSVHHHTYAWIWWGILAGMSRLKHENHEPPVG